MIQSTDELPINFGFYAKANSSSTKVVDPSLHEFAKELEDQLIAGAIGLRLSENAGVTPASIDSCLRLADFYDVSCILDTDSFSEAHDVDLQGVIKNRVAAIPLTKVNLTAPRLLGEALTYTNLINISALESSIEEELHELGVASVVTSASFNTENLQVNLRHFLTQMCLIHPHFIINFII